MPRPKRQPPRTFSADWPNEPCNDPVAEVIRQIAVSLHKLASGNSMRALAQKAGVDHSVVHDLVRGNSWPEVATVARLELGLKVRLWPVQAL